MKPRQRCWGSAVLVFLHAALAHAIDLQPGEIKAPVPDHNLVQLIYQDSHYGDLYSHGIKQPGSPGIDLSQTQLLLGRSFEIAEHPAIFYAQPGIGSIRGEGSLSRLPGDNGTGDTCFLLAFWPYANRATQTYFAVGAYLIAPTGDYDRTRTLNLGQNRYIRALQAGYQAPLADALSWMAVLDTVWFGDNNDYGIKSGNLAQKPLTTGQAALRYEFNRVFSLGASYFHSVGGETSLNGISRNDTTRLKRYQVTGKARLPFGRITLQYGGDLSTDNGFIEDRRWIARYTKLF